VPCSPPFSDTVLLTLQPITGNCANESALLAVLVRHPNVIVQTRPSKSAPDPPHVRSALHLRMYVGIGNIC
jgi:hypothetical protein